MASRRIKLVLETGKNLIYKEAMNSDFVLRYRKSIPGKLVKGPITKLHSPSWPGIHDVSQSNPASASEHRG